MGSLLRHLWAFPVTLVGLSFALMTALTGGSVQCRDGVVEAYGGFAGWFLKGGWLRKGGAAMTLGHVILARDASCLDRSRSHELAHVRQFERWGVFLLPAYWSVMLWLWYRGHDPYLDHPLEPGEP